MSRPQALCQLAAVEQRLGRLEARSKGGAQQFDMRLETDASGQKVTALERERKPLPSTRASPPGVACLCRNQTQWEASQPWRTYV